MSRRTCALYSVSSHSAARLITSGRGWWGQRAATASFWYSDFLLCQPLPPAPHQHQRRISKRSAMRLLRFMRLRAWSSVDSSLLAVLPRPPQAPGLLSTLSGRWRQHSCYLNTTPRRSTILAED
ncbi:hypothetical protein BDV95DRAFT_168436 [Massariosphaeria phaeospora]|uniref:Uncharacterized protein n=1 Tax=Massariosphaeria phaeospora TaxID=100035 RepID=A0A7C8I160_9PLEO|nr:hypothetical protein BDV95DRAFT_168436 [Massariosphaeria phaeospora]